MAKRNYSNTAPPLVLVTTVDADDVTFVVGSTAGYPDVPFTLGIERGSEDEEFCLCTAKDATTFTVTRGYDGTVGVGHTGGVAVIEHAIGAIDYREANLHMEHGSHYSEVINKVALSGAAVALDFRTAVNWDVMLSANCTFSFTNVPPAGRMGTLFLLLRNGGAAYTAAFPASVKWAGGSPPALSGTGKADLFTFITVDGGATFAGMVTSDFAGVG